MLHKSWLKLHLIHVYFQQWKWFYVYTKIFSRSWDRIRAHFVWLLLTLLSHHPTPCIHPHKSTMWAHPVYTPVFQTCISNSHFPHQGPCWFSSETVGTQCIPSFWPFCCRLTSCMLHMVSTIQHTQFLSALCCLESHLWSSTQNYVLYSSMFKCNYVYTHFIMGIPFSLYGYTLNFGHSGLLLSPCKPQTAPA